MQTVSPVKKIEHCTKLPAHIEANAKSFLRDANDIVSHPVSGLRCTVAILLTRWCNGGSASNSKTSFS